MNNEQRTDAIECAHILVDQVYDTNGFPPFGSERGKLFVELLRTVMVVPAIDQLTAAVNDNTEAIYSRNKA
jgi:hypothetical protein